MPSSTPVEGGRSEATSVRIAFAYSLKRGGRRPQPPCLPELDGIPARVALAFDHMSRFAQHGLRERLRHMC